MGPMKLWGIVAAAVILAASGCSSAPKNGDGDDTVTATIDGQKVRLDHAASRTPRGLAVWFHGQGGDADTRMNEEWLNALRVDGWDVASSDFHGNAWGNQDAVNDTAALVGWAKQESGSTGPLLFVAGSMGGLNSLTYMAGPGDDPACWYGTMPVVDVTKVDTVKDSAEQISAAYDGAAPAPLDLAELPAAKYRVLASPSDTWVPKVQHADVLTAALNAQGREVSTLTVSGEHGHLSHFRAADLAEFAKTCA